MNNLFQRMIQPEILQKARENVISSHVFKRVHQGTRIQGEKREEMGMDRILHHVNSFPYEPQPIRKIFLPLPGGKTYPFGIPSFEDWVLQEAARIILHPILTRQINIRNTEKKQRIKEVVWRIKQSIEVKRLWWIIQGDISSYIEEIPHRKLLGMMKHYLHDAQEILHLLRLWFGAGFRCRNGNVSRPNCGVYQAGVLGELLAESYLYQVDKQYDDLGKNQDIAEGKEVEYIRYQGQILVMTNGTKLLSTTLKEQLSSYLQQLGFPFKENVSLRHVHDGFHCEGFFFQKKYPENTRNHCILVTPCEESIASFKQSIKCLTEANSIFMDVAEKICAINAVTRQWEETYRCTQNRGLFRKLTFYTHKRMFCWLKRKHANISAKKSVEKYVIKKYLKNKRWSCDGNTLISLLDISSKKYN